MKKILTAIFVILFTVIMSNLFVIRCYPVLYSDSIKSYSQEYNLKEELVYAVIKCESSFVPTKTSDAGAVGLMQIMPSTYRYIMNNDTDSNKLFEPAYNIMVGCKYLRYLFDKFGDETLVLCAYNAGETNVYNWLKDSELSTDGKELKYIPFKETMEYVKRVLESKKIYSAILK